MYNRALSTLPISVGTGLAIESLTQTPIYKYNSLLFNIRTLFRNMIGSFEDKQLPDNEYLAQCLIDDIIGIGKTISTLKFNSHLDLVFYQPSYKKLELIFPYASIKKIEDKKATKKQYAMEQRREAVTKLLYSEFKKIITDTDVGFPSFSGTALVMTHHPVDLVVSGLYTRINLLESHTGAIKRFSEFNTKLTGYKKIPNIPLNKLTIQVFGDHATNFYSLPIGVRNEIKHLADTKKWSTASSPSHCESTIRDMVKSPEKEILLNLIK